MTNAGPGRGVASFLGGDTALTYPSISSQLRHVEQPRVSETFLSLTRERMFSAGRYEQALGLPCVVPIWLRTVF